MDLRPYNKIEINHNRFLPILYKMFSIAALNDNKIVERFRKIFNSDIANIKTHQSSFYRFTSRLYSFCDRYYEYFEMDREVLKGDLFEIFVEIFLKTNGNNEKILIHNYSVIHNGEDCRDIGVDGVGLDMNNEPCTIQIKYRNIASPKLTTSSLTQFIGASITNYNVSTESKAKSFILITNTLKEVDYRINKVGNNRVKIINGDCFDTIIGTSKTFWYIVQYILSNNYDKKKKVAECEYIRDYENLFYNSFPVINIKDVETKTYEERKWSIFDTLG
jgi:hypothetical protein